MEPLMEQLDWRDKIKNIGLETGPSVKGEIMIETPADQVWDVISEEGNLKKCHPFCNQLEIIKWPGADAVDTIAYYSGITYKRNFVGWEEGVGYDIELGDYPNLTARVLWRIVPKGENRCRFSIEVFPYLKDYNARMRILTAGLTRVSRWYGTRRLVAPGASNVTGGLVLARVRSDLNDYFIHYSRTVDSLCRRANCDMKSLQ